MAKAVIEAPLGAFISFGLSTFIYFGESKNVEKKFLDSLLGDLWPRPFHDQADCEVPENMPCLVIA